MTNTYNDIESTLKAAVTTVVAVNQSDNQHYNPQLLTPWVRTTLLPSESQNLTRGTSPTVRISGLYQIDVVTPAGSGYINTTVNQLLDYFYNNRMLPTQNSNNVRVINTWRSVSTQDADWYITPVTLRWEYFYTTI